jgi:hypothetical protein
VKSLIGKLHPNGGDLPEGIDPQLGGIAKDSHDRLLISFFDDMERPFVALQKLVMDPALVEQSQKNVADATCDIEKTRSSQKEFARGRDDMMTKETAQAVSDAEKRAG